MFCFACTINVLELVLLQFQSSQENMSSHKETLRNKISRYVLYMLFVYQSSYTIQIIYAKAAQSLNNVNKIKILQCKHNITRKIR